MKTNLTAMLAALFIVALAGCEQLKAINEDAMNKSFRRNDIENAQRQWIQQNTHLADDASIPPEVRAVFFEIANSNGCSKNQVSLVGPHKTPAENADFWLVRMAPGCQGGVGRTAYGSEVALLHAKNPGEIYWTMPQGNVFGSDVLNDADLNQVNAYRAAFVNARESNHVFNYPTIRNLEQKYNITKSKLD